MPTVSGLTVRFGRKIQPVQYEEASASIDVSISFDQDETADLDETINSIFDTVQAHVYARLGRQAPNVTAREPAKTAEAPKLEESAPEKKETAAAKKKRVAAEKKAAKEAAAAAKAPADDESPEGMSAANAEPVGDLTADQEEIPDGDMTKAVTNKMQALVKGGAPNGGAPIIALIKSMVSEAPFTPARVPAEQRREFLKALDAIGAEVKE